MQNPASRSNPGAGPRAETAANRTGLCPACGYELLGPDVEACSWRSSALWEIFGLSNVACGGCGEYLGDIWHSSR